MPTSPTITVGGTELDLGDLSGTRITGVAWDADEVTELARALEGAQAGSAAFTAGDAGTAVVEGPESVADSLRRAGCLWDAVASDRDPDVPRAEVDELLLLFERLADTGRVTEALQLARPLERLLMVTGRWAEVDRVLERASVMARSAGYQAALGWAKHEQGTLRLVARDVEEGERKLRAAHALRRRVGDRTGSAATEANLRAARRPRLRTARRAWPTAPSRTGRGLRPVAMLLPLLAVGVVAGGVFAGLGDILPEAATPAAPPVASEPERHRSSAGPDEWSARSRDTDPVDTGAAPRPSARSAKARVQPDRAGERRAPEPVRRPDRQPKAPAGPAPDSDRPVDLPPAPPQDDGAPQPQVALVELEIEAEGARVVVNGSELSCPPTCELSFEPGERVELRAEPADRAATPLDSFEWGGACRGRQASDATCTVVMDEATRVTVTHRAPLQGILDLLAPLT